MRILIYSLLIIFAAIAFSKPETVHHQIDLLMQDEKALEKQADLDIKEWNDGLFEELLINKNPNVRIFSIRLLLNPIDKSDSDSPEFNQASIDEINTFIDGIINDIQVEPQALNILSAYCFEGDKNYQCDNERLLEKLIELDPNNIASYVSLLDKALESQDSTEIKQVLSTMANASFHNHYFHMHADLENAVINYAEKHPLPESYLDISMEQLGFRETLQKLTQEELEDINLYSMLVGIKMAIPMPAYRVFTETCRTSLNYKEACIKISDTFINNSFTYIAKSIGYAIQKEIYKNSGDEKQNQAIQLASDKFSDVYSCLTKTLYPQYNQGILFTKEMYQLANKAEIEKGEIAGLRKLAELNYQNQISRGNDIAINPASCF